MGETELPLWLARGWVSAHAHRAERKMLSWQHSRQAPAATTPSESPLLKVPHRPAETGIVPAGRLIAPGYCVSENILVITNLQTNRRAYGGGSTASTAVTGKV